MSVCLEQSSIVALSCQGPVAQSPISKLSGLMSVLSLVVHKAGGSKTLEGPSPAQAAGKESTPARPYCGLGPWQVAKDWGFPFHCSMHGAGESARVHGLGLYMPDWMLRTVCMPSCD